jgi:hypothetical protein
VASAACGGDDTSGGGDLGDTNTSGDGDVAGAAPTVVITAPEAGLVAPAGSTVTLAATVGRASGGLDTLEVEWTSDRVTAPLARVVADASGRTSASTQTLPAGAHVLTATVIAPDGQRATASVSITIDALPSAAVVHIEPREPKTTDDLAVVIDTAASDPDGAVTLSYRWLVDGVDAQVRTANVPASKTARGQTWKVEVVAEDEVGNAATTTAEVVIGNSAPTCGQALVLPSGGTTSTTFTCRCSDRADADGDDAADTCTFKDGDDVLATGSCTLDPSLTTRGMGVTCVLVPSDGDAQGEAVTSAVVAVMNAAPSAPAITLAPVVAGAVDAGSELECQVTTLGVDPTAIPSPTRSAGRSTVSLPRSRAAPPPPLGSWLGRWSSMSAARRRARAAGRSSAARPRPRTAPTPRDSSRARRSPSGTRPRWWTTCWSSRSTRAAWPRDTGHAAWPGSPPIPMATC